MSSSPRYLLDTSAVIDLPRPGQLPPDAELLISSITIAELNAGIHANEDPVKRAQRIDKLWWVADTFDVLPFTESAGRMYGQLYARVLAIGRNPKSRQLDLLIASVAAVHQLPLVTRNAKDFLGLAPTVEVVDLGGPGGG